MKKVIILLVLMTLISCGHYRWFYKHRNELCSCDTVRTVIYRQTPYEYNWRLYPIYKNTMPYNDEPVKFPFNIIDTSLIIGDDTIQHYFHPGVYLGNDSNVWLE